jgi:iron complex outermembrane receptor protein
VPVGNRIAGTQRFNAWAALSWRDARWGEWAMEAREVGATAVNDTNSDFAAGYQLLALRWQQSYALAGGQRLDVLARLDNALDRRYAGSVIVNDGNARYFETGAPRTALLSLRWLGGF